MSFHNTNFNVNVGWFGTDITLKMQELVPDKSSQVDRFSKNISVCLFRSKQHFKITRLCGNDDLREHMFEKLQVPHQG